MPAEIITVGFCPQYFASFVVAGSRGVSYTVAFDGADLDGSCSCAAFKFSGARRSCKHLRLVQAHGCFWNPQWHDEGPNDLAAQGISLVGELTRTSRSRCPGCGYDTLPVRIAI